MAQIPKNHPILLLGLVVAAFLLPPCLCIASPVMGVTSNTWDPGDGVDGWTNLNVLDPPTVVINPDDYLSIHFTNREPWEAPAEDTIYATNEKNTGDFSAVSMGVRFNFYVTNVSPDLIDVRVYMKGGTSGLTWYQSFSHVTEGWAWHTVSFEYPDMWEGGTSAQFLDDLTNVTAIGIFVGSPSLDAHEYGLDSWMYIYVPEPGTICMLAAAFLSLGIPFRKRLTSAFHFLA